MHPLFIKNCEQESCTARRKGNLPTTYREIQHEVLGVVLFEISLAHLAVDLAHRHFMQNRLHTSSRVRHVKEKNGAAGMCVAREGASARTTLLFLFLSCRRRVSNSLSLMMGLPSAYLLAATCAPPLKSVPTYPYKASRTKMHRMQCPMECDSIRVSCVSCVSCRDTHINLNSNQQQNW